MNKWNGFKMDELKSLYVDSPSWHTPIKVDDFLVAVGKLKSNSVYHVFEVKSKTGEKTDPIFNEGV